MTEINTVIGVHKQNRKPKFKRSARVWKEWLTGYLMLLPNLIGFLAFTLGPVIAAFGLSMTKYNVITSPRFTGLGNFARMAKDPMFAVTLKNTVVFAAMSLPLQIMLGLALAVLVNQDLKTVGLYRAAFMVPWVSMSVAVGLAWMWLLSSDFGLVNYVLGLVGIPRQRWLQSMTLALPSVVVVTAWKRMGWDMVLFLAGLQGIPQYLYEAAALDGASAWQRFRHITLPLLQPVLFFVTIVTIIDTFQTFDMVYVMTQGGPGDATYVFGLFVYRQAFKYGRMGYAAALSVVLFAIVVGVTLLQYKFIGERVSYELG